MPEDNAATLRTEIEDREKKLSLDRRGMYEILLGHGIIDSMIETLGEEGSQQFLDGHYQFDRAIEKSSEIDFFELVPVHEITAFKSFKEYIALLNSLLGKLKMMQSDDANVVRKALEDLLELATPKQTEPTEAVAGAKMISGAPKYGTSVFTGKSLPAIPLSLERRELLPYSYPDFDKTLGTVLGHCKRSGFNKDLVNDLNACARKSLEALAFKRKYVDKVESDFRNYLVEAQAYLRDTNWLGYGITTRKLVTAAVDSGAKVKLDTGLGTVVISCVRTEAYAFLGVNLEMVLRRAIVSLAKDSLSNYFFEGRQSGVDVVVSTSSQIVQDYAVEWLEKLTEAFDEKAE